jgi:hypothetical protein
MPPAGSGRRGVQGFGGVATGVGGGAISRATGIKGTNDFLALSKALKDAGETGLRRELHAAMRQAAKPLLPKVKDAARASLPKRGGLNARIAKAPLRTQVRTGAKTAGVRIVGTKVDPRINTGRVYHPVFGRKPGVVQQVPAAAGYFDKTLSEGGPAVRAVLLQTLADFTDRIVREGRG